MPVAIWLLLALLLLLPAAAVGVERDPRAREHAVARHDAVYDTLSPEPWDAMPVGGGDLSAMVRCDGDLHLHLSKSDCWGFRLPADAAPGDRFFNNVSPGHVSIAFEHGRAMAARRFRQRLDLYHGRIVLELGDGEAAARVVVWGHPRHRVLVVEVQDPSHALGAMRVSLAEWRDTMRVSTAGGDLRAVEVQPRPARPHLANTGMENAMPGGRDPLQGRGDAVVIRAVCGAGKIPGVAGQEAHFDLAADDRGMAVLAIAAAVTVSGDPGEAAERALSAALRTPLHDLRDEHAAWWRDFWDRSAIDAASPDGMAARVAGAYHVHLYTLGCVNRGAYPAKWDGGPGLMRGDERNWGLSEWVQEVRFTYMPLYAANLLEMARALPDHYAAMAPYLRAQTATMWGLPGAWVPETTLPWGHAEDFVLKRGVGGKPAWYMEAWDPAHERFGRFECYNPYVGFMFTPGLEISQHFLDYARYSGDERFLRRTAYPFVRDVCEFVASLLNRGEDGRWHLEPANALETWWLARDPADTLAGIAAIFPEVVRLADRYRVDRALRDRLAGIAADLADAPRGLWDDAGIHREDPVYAPAASLGRVTDRHNAEHPGLYRVYPFGLSRIGTEDFAVARDTFVRRPYGIYHGWALDAVWAARLGLGEDAGRLIAEHCRQYQRFRYGGWTSNDSRVFPGGLSSTPFLDAGGCSGFALQEMLLQTVAGVIHMAPAVPEAWSGSFTLRAEGGFVVSAAFAGGRAAAVTVRSLFGRECRIANPFAGEAVVTVGKRVALRSADRELRFRLRRGSAAGIAPAATGGGG